MTAISEARPGQIHANPTDTEVEAAQAVAPQTGKLRVEALKWLRLSPQGLTDDEGGALMGGDRLTFGRRRHELVDEGLVVDSGFRRVGPSGRKAIVWVVA